VDGPDHVTASPGQSLNTGPDLIIYCD
jgi:hypothetical protein